MARSSHAAAAPGSLIGCAVVMVLKYVKAAQAAALLAVYSVACAAACAVGAVSAQAQVVAPAPSSRAATIGPAIPMGGGVHADNPLWQRIVDLAGGKGSRIAVIGVASGRPDLALAYARQRFEAAGATVEFIDIRPPGPNTETVNSADHPGWVEAVGRAQAVYFSGGAQARIVDTLQPQGRMTPLLKAIHELQARGGVVAGTSAGAAIMSTVMFRDAPYLIDALKGRMQLGREVDRGLGFVAPDILIDQHFLKRGRVGRMVPVMFDHGFRLGVGVEEDTGVVMQGDEFEVVGRRAAVVLDFTEAKREPVGTAWRAHGALVSLLEPGDRFHLPTRTVRPAAAKLGSPINPSEPGFDPSFEYDRFFMDMLGDHAIANAMAHLVDGQRSVIRGLAHSTLRRPGDDRPGLGFEFVLTRDLNTRAWSAFGIGSLGYTISRVRMDINPVRLAVPLYEEWKEPR